MGHHDEQFINLQYFPVVVYVIYLDRREIGKEERQTHVIWLLAFTERHARGTPLTYIPVGAWFNNYHSEHLLHSSPFRFKHLPYKLNILETTFFFSKSENPMAFKNLGNRITKHCNICFFNIKALTSNTYSTVTYRSILVGAVRILCGYLRTASTAGVALPVSCAVKFSVFSGLLGSVIGMEQSLTEGKSNGPLLSSVTLEFGIPNTPCMGDPSAAFLGNIWSTCTVRLLWPSCTR